VGVLTDGRGERRRAETGHWWKNSGQYLGFVRWSFPGVFPATGRGSGGTAQRCRSRDGVGLLWKRSEAALANGQQRSAKAAVLGRLRRCYASETRRLEQGGGAH
jgi:hypothetical protein